MKFSSLVSAVLSAGLFAASSVLQAAAPSPVDSVDPFIGTDGHGHVFPGAARPFGMAVLSPDTRTETWDGTSGYHYTDQTILGFSHTHLSGTGGGCLGDIMVMPTVGDIHLDAGQPGNGYMSRFSHKSEEAHPGYYKVFLEDPKVTAELTATERCGIHRYTFPASDAAHIVLDLNHGIQNGATDSQAKVENSTTISGYRKSNGWGGSRIIYYVMQFSRPFESYGFQKNGQRLPDGTTDASGGPIQGFVTYKTKANETILIKVGISGTSLDGARKNLNTEIPGWDFDGVRRTAAQDWNRNLSTAQIETPDPHLRRTFYTNLYLSYIQPSLYNDADGTYRGMDHQIHTDAKFQNYTTFSLWDTYRAEHPLLTILQPGRVDDMINTLLTQSQQSGIHSTPIWPLWDNETWCMIGYHSVDVMAEAYLKGFRGFDAEAAYKAMREAALRDGDYHKLGYVASQNGAGATSRTIEYSIDDWSVAKMAEALGHDDDARMFYKRAANYYNVFDRSSGFQRGRKADGSWRSPFDAIGLINDEYTEANAWQYAFGAQHDVPGMISMYGGDAPFVQKLDTMFSMSSKTRTSIPDITGLIGQYAQGDEQCHHVAYLYNYAGQPYKTQQHVRQIMDMEYSDTPGGECGNVDCGQMSAWYIFSALGFYPVNPSSGVYVIGSPVVNKAVLHLDSKQYGGRAFTMIAENNGPKNIYVQSATWNGKPYNKTWFTHGQLTGGGTLKLVMGPKPNAAWGSDPAARPPATMPSGFVYPVLPAPAEDKIVKLEVPIRVVCGSDEPVGNFVPDPNMLDGLTNHTDAAVEAASPNAAPAAVYQSERYGNDFTYELPVPTDRSYTVRLHFAEVFDKDAGQRLQNVEINGATVLSNFDIIATAGGTHKAVVRGFIGVKPDASGKILIRVSSAADSPDKNAKLSALEILPE